MIYERIKAECKRQKTSVNQMEKDLGIGKGSVCKMDVHKPSIEKITKIAKYLNVSADYLLTGIEEKYSPESAKAFAAIATDEELNDMIVKFMKLSMEDRAFICKMINRMSE